jgi:hypothetical protein
VIQYFDWKASWWVQQADLRTEVSPALKRGLHAYASKQATMYRCMAMACASCWHPIFVKEQVVVDWLRQYIPATVETDLD